VMTCKTAAGTICNYLEGNLSTHGAMAIRRHLDECKDCRLVVEVAERTLEIYFDRVVASVSP
jgi:predicted anti-sigma-YlaC factor YlaD